MITANQLTRAEKAYALLWEVRTADHRVHMARRILLREIGKDGQRKALTWIRQPPTKREIDEE